MESKYGVLRTNSCARIFRNSAIAGVVTINFSVVLAEHLAFIFGKVRVSFDSRENFAENLRRLNW